MAHIHNSQHNQHFLQRNFPQVQILIFLCEATQGDHISLNSVQNLLDVLGVVDMCHLLLNTNGTTSCVNLSEYENKSVIFDEKMNHSEKEQPVNVHSMPGRYATKNLCTWLSIMSLVIYKVENCSKCLIIHQLILHLLWCKSFHNLL